MVYNVHGQIGRLHIIIQLVPIQHYLHHPGQGDVQHVALTHSTYKGTYCYLDMLCELSCLAEAADGPTIYITTLRW